MGRGTSNVFQFLDYELDCDAAELRKSGAPLEIEPQVFDLIAFLVENPGRLVHREEIIDAVWDGRLVSDSTISSRINAARRALGDDGRAQAIIKTIHGRGFRFEVLPETQREFYGDANVDNEAEPSNETLSLPGKPSVAVLPFAAYSGDEKHEYFAEGVTDDVIIGLSRVSALFVIARNSTFNYKNRPRDTSAIARELGVKYLVDGGIRFSGSKVRVSAQLIDTATGRLSWSETIDRDLVDTFVVQDDISRSIVSAVQTQILLNEGDASEDKLEATQHVSDQLNRAWRATADWTRDGLEDASSLAMEALDKDPRNPRAQIIMALVRYGQAYLGYVADPIGCLEAGSKYANEAVQLSPNDEYAHWVMACCFWCLGDHEKGISHAERAIEISPSFSWAHGTLGTALAWSGSYDLAIERTELALRYNPRDTTIYFRYLVLALSNFGLQNFEEALRYADRVIRRNPAWFLGHVFKIASLMALDRVEQAKRAVRESRAYVPDITTERVMALPFGEEITRSRVLDALKNADALGTSN